MDNHDARPNDPDRLNPGWFPLPDRYAEALREFGGVTPRRCPPKVGEGTLEDLHALGWIVGCSPEGTRVRNREFVSTLAGNAAWRMHNEARRDGRRASVPLPLDC